MNAIIENCDRENQQYKKVNKVVGWKATLELSWADGTTEKISDYDFSDDLIGQIDYEISDYEESKEMIEGENNDD